MSMSNKKHDIIELKEKLEKEESRISSSLSTLLDTYKLSQTDFAKIVGLDNQTVNNWLSTKTKSPKWMNVLYKTILLFHMLDKNFDSLYLFNISYKDELKSIYSKLKKQHEEIIKWKLKLEENDKLIQKMNTRTDYYREIITRMVLDDDILKIIDQYQNLRMRDNYFENEQFSKQIKDFFEKHCKR